MSFLYVIYGCLVSAAAGETIDAWHLHGGRQIAVSLFAIAFILLGAVISTDKES